MDHCLQILNIPHKVTRAPPAKYLVPEDLKILLSTPEISTRKGRRHLVLLTVLYDTAARVSELVDVRLRDIRLESPATIILHARADNEAKRAALEKATKHLDLPIASGWERDSGLIEWLSSLG